MYAGLRVKRLLFLADCTKHCDIPTELIKNPKYEISPKFALEWRCSLPPFGRTGMTELRRLCERACKRTELVLSVLRFSQRCIRGSKCCVSVG